MYIQYNDFFLERICDYREETWF